MGRSARALERWIRAAAVPIALDGDGPVDAFSTLDRIAEGARVAYVVESHHFVHEKYAFRLLALRYLASRGWTWFGEELGWSDGLRVDEHLRTGDEGALDRIATYGYEGVRRTDREDRPTGILRAGEDAYPQPELRYEQQRFAREVRATIPGARWFGFDVDGWATAGYEPLRERGLALEQVVGETIAEEAARLARVDVTEQPAVVRRTVDALVTTLEYAASAYPAPTYEDLRPAMAIREQLMHRHVDAVLDEPELGGPDGRVALQAGSLHLVKDDEVVAAAEGGVGPGGALVPSIGHHVAHRPDIDAGRVLSIWMLCGSGRDSNPMVTEAQAIEPQRGTLNRVLARACDGEPVLVPLAGCPVDVVTIQHMYGATFTTPITGQLDAVVFAPEVQPLHAPA